jgi:hypothetical protein
MDSYFTRRTVAEHLRFATRTIVQRSTAGSRSSVGLKDNPFLCHVRSTPSRSLSAVFSAVSFRVQAMR